MPENMSLMASLIERYGKEKAQDIYWGMVGEGKGPFAPGGKYRYEHEAMAKRNGVAPSQATRAKKKPASKRKRASRRR